MRRLRCSQQRTIDFVGSDINRCSGTVPVVDGFNIMPRKFSITRATAISALKRAFSAKSRENHVCSSHYPRETHAPTDKHPNGVSPQDNSGGQTGPRAMAFAPGSRCG
jgi:hypothetical protein